MPDDIKQFLIDNECALTVDYDGKAALVSVWSRPSQDGGEYRISTAQDADADLAVRTAVMMAAKTLGVIE